MGTVDMNEMGPGLEAGDLPAHMDTTDDLVPTLDVSDGSFVHASDHPY